MQGRLLPKFEGRFQAHPLGYWEQEFPIAAELGLDCIEFIFDYQGFEKNPLWNANGVSEIKQISKATGVEVLTICADFFMECPLHSKCPNESDFSTKTLIRLLEQSNALGVTDVIIPCVDQSSINHFGKLELLENKIRELIPIASKLGVRLCLETDLPPRLFGDFLRSIDSSSVSINYDTGNSAALGYDFNEELAEYRFAITDLHIKDRLLGGGSITLGEGDVDFNGFFQALGKFDYKGPIIIQAYRDDEGVSIFLKQFEFLNKLLTKHY